MGWLDIKQCPSTSTATVKVMRRVLAKRTSPSAVRRAQRNGNDIHYGPLKDWIGFNLRMAQDSSFQAFSRLSKEIGVRPGRFATLTLIGNNPGISQTALSRANGRDKSTLTPLLVDLVRRRLVRRVQAQNDRRSYQLFLTKAGDRLLDQLTACAREHERKLDAVIGMREGKQFLRTLKKLADEMD